MSLLSQSELDRMRKVAESAFDKTCKIVRLVRSSDGMGGTSETWNDAYTNVPCAIAPRGGAAEDDEDSVIRGRSSLVLTLPSSQDITTSDRVEIEGRTFEVLDAHFRTYQVTKRVELAEVT